MTRKQPLTDIERQAITMWELIQRTLRKYDYTIPQTHLRVIRKATRKFLKNAKNTKYDAPDRFGVSHLVYIDTHLHNKEDFDSVYLSWLQMQFHGFIHQYCPEHDPNYKPNRQPYYDKMIEALTS